MPNTRRALSCFALAALLAGCGSRAAPLPPLRPEAPPFLNVVIAQLGSEVVLEFDPLPAIATVSGEEVVLDELEILVLAELYPVITAEMLAAALPDERVRRIREAREAAGIAAERLGRDRDARAAALAAARAAEQGIELATEEDEEATEPAEEDEEATLTEEELLLRRVPRDAIGSWRAAEVPPAAILEAARRFDNAVNSLWTELRLPTAIIDRREPPDLPGPDAILAAAIAVESRLRYETGRGLPEFLETSAAARSVPYDDLADHLVGTKVVMRVPVGVGAAAGDHVRTRYWLGVRARSTRNHAGLVQTLASLAPMPVPVPPPAVTVTLTEKRVLLTWEAPTVDIYGDALPDDRIRYNVYRRVVPPPQASLARQPGGSTEANTEGRPERRARPATPAPALLTPAPIAERDFADATMTLGRTYVYEVRALLAPVPPRTTVVRATVAPADTPIAALPVAIPGPRKEGLGGLTPEIIAEDIYPPLKVSALTAVRAGNRVSLRWTASTSTDLGGYRVYRHQMPAPELPAHRLTLPPATAATPAGTGPAADAAVPVPALAGAEPPPSMAVQEPVADPQGETEQEPVADPQGETEQEPETGRRRNELVAAGWELLTTPRITDVSYTDLSSDPAVGWTYLVEAVDTAGNVSVLERVVVAAPEQQ